MLSALSPRSRLMSLAALKEFNAGTEGFKDRDLYVFCGDATDGLITA